MDELNLNVLKNIVRTGWVSSVNVEERTARVIFQDKGETVVSGDLKILANQPVITIEEWADGAKWNYDAQYSSADRSLGLGESYVKAAPAAMTSEIKCDGLISRPIRSICHRLYFSTALSTSCEIFAAPDAFGFGM